MSDCPPSCDDFATFSAASPGVVPHRVTIELSTTPLPMVDAVIAFTAWPGAATSTCRFRVWPDRRVVVLSEIAENEGASVTNGAEAAHVAACDSLAVLGYVDATGSEFAAWEFFEHYPANSRRGSTLDHVRALPAGVKWTHAGPAYDWLRAALADD